MIQYICTPTRTNLVHTANPLVAHSRPPGAPRAPPPGPDGRRRGSGGAARPQGGPRPRRRRREEPAPRGRGGRRGRRAAPGKRRPWTWSEPGPRALPFRRQHECGALSAIGTEAPEPAPHAPQVAQAARAVSAGAAREGRRSELGSGRRATAGAELHGLRAACPGSTAKIYTCTPII